MEVKELDLIITTHYALPCSCEKFTINGIDADSYDFGESEDIRPDLAEPYGCGSHEFAPKMPTQEVLNKYNINVDEYAEIAGELQSALYVGQCGWCI
jgi:hypothetical protein